MNDPARAPVNVMAVARAAKSMLDERFSGYALIGFIAGCDVPLTIINTDRSELRKLALMAKLQEAERDIAMIGEEPRAEAGRVFRPMGIVKPEEQVFSTPEVIGYWRLDLRGDTLTVKRLSNKACIWKTLVLDDCGMAFVRIVRKT